MKGFRTFIGTAGTTGVALVGILVITLSVVLAGCVAEDGMEFPLDDPGMSISEQQRVHNEWRVDMIMGSLRYAEMLAEYGYDDDGRLVKAYLSERNTWQNTSYMYEERFEWWNNRPVKQLTAMEYTGNGYREDVEQDFEVTYKYDAGGRLMHHGADDNWPGGRQYEYDDRGRLVQTYIYEFGGMTYKDRLEWDESGNVIKHICAGPLQSDFMEPMPGTYHEWVYEYEYDNHPKPNFGLSSAFFWDGRYSPWPSAGNTDEQMARTLSRNNLTRCEASGYGYRYTYNEEGLPATVQQIWIGPTRSLIISTENMVQTIVYKRVAE